MDPAYWVDNEKDIASIQFIAEYFQQTLNSKNNFDKNKLNNEFKDLKFVVSHYYQGVKALQLWKSILLYRSSEFPNISMLLCIGPSNSVVESGFSVLTATLTDLRLNLDNKTMEDLLLIRTNHKVWSPQERDEIIYSAHTSLKKKRRCT